MIRERRLEDRAEGKAVSGEVEGRKTVVWMQTGRDRREDGRRRADRGARCVERVGAFESRGDCAGIVQ